MHWGSEPPWYVGSNLKKKGIPPVLARLMEVQEMMISQWIWDIPFWDKPISHMLHVWKTYQHLGHKWSMLVYSAWQLRHVGLSCQRSSWTMALSEYIVPPNWWWVTFFLAIRNSDCIISGTSKWHWKVFPLSNFSSVGLIWLPLPTCKLPDSRETKGSGHFHWIPSPRLG